ncbi:SAM-dependent methyltransferase [Deinobacterium chartae]|uniref:SAM-dependent methyltransferase n=1 Tax=Deinobacterium chartae TaxID=521158 RepID=A0A841HZ88_9DEIO|nr:class I SAM-dependent methyltransferase [Deinobacterium chartae]MBB6097308.1 SAM-dependent methyltransferase [Deinobacterium chartae]
MGTRDPRDTWTPLAENWPAQRARREGAVDALIIELARRHLAGPVLDAGCGSGEYTAALHALGLEVLGTDATPAMLGVARRQFPQLAFQAADLLALPFADAAFGGVFCLTVLEWVTDPWAALREVVRVTRPGGTLLLGVLGAGNRVRDRHLERFLSGQSPMNGLLPWELESLLRHADLELIESCGAAPSGRLEGDRAAMTRAMLWLFVARRAG